jgi:hypothetical protein
MARDADPVSLPGLRPRNGLFIIESGKKCPREGLCQGKP